MARDYKYRANQNKSKKHHQANKVVWWKWLLVLLLVTLFIIFLIFLGSSNPQHTGIDKPKTVSITKKTNKPKSPPKQQKRAVEPRFDFYTILPETEIVVPDYEINTRSREEKFGKAKATKYLIQAGSFRNFSEADKLRARLALMGIESRVEKAKIGNVIWNRVKIGPYTQSSSVFALKKRLKSNGVDVVVLEVKS